jgi:hypothetical protein
LESACPERLGERLFIFIRALDDSNWLGKPWLTFRINRHLARSKFFNSIIHHSRKIWIHKKLAANSQHARAKDISAETADPNRESIAVEAAIGGACFEIASMRRIATLIRMGKLRGKGTELVSPR